VTAPTRPILTTERRLGAGHTLRAGSRAAYRSVAEMPGEPHTVRSELLGDGASLVEMPSVTEPILCLAHMTDLHVTDVQSPARFEFVNREWQDPRFRELLTMQRPHEALNTHAVAAMVRTVNHAGVGPVTGAPVRLVAMTGDAVDNTQRNELSNFLALMNGGDVKPDSGAPGYAGVQAPGWPGDIYWKPDGAPEHDVFQSELGYPSRPGLLDEAMAPFRAEGLRVPWLGCYGNHEQVCQGVGIVTEELARAMSGTQKPVVLPPGIDRDHVVDIFIEHPERFMAGECVEVAPDADRRPISRAEFVESLARSGGHGFRAADSDRFGAADGERGGAYYFHDEGSVRFITLDTVCDAGAADGSIDEAQLAWLARTLEHVHSSFRARDGSTVRTANEDRLVVILSHHGYDTLSNPRGEGRAGELLALLLRFDNVVLWLNGHIHANRITPRPDGRGQGFWEVTTSSLVDWPCQARLVELFRCGQGLLGIACTMLDHDGEGLAGLHRELAANVPFSDFDSWRPGSPADRNVVLLLPAPF